MNKKMLVSVRVVSYNAEKTIIETLESIKRQTYSNIELIVSDDCSKDNTVEITHKWIEENKERFVRTELLTVTQNTGICANLNRALKACKGEWIKGIAADDILLPNCIEDFVSYINEHKNVYFVASLQRVYNESFEECNYINTTGYILPKLLMMSATEQLRHIAFHVPIMAPTTFTSRKMLETIGGYDERYTYEDHPMYVSMLEHGFKVYFLNKETVAYRIHSSSFNSSGKIFNPKFIPHSIEFRKNKCFKYYNWRQKMALRVMWMIYSLFEKLNMNHSTKINLFIFKRFMAFCWHFGRVK